MRLRHLRYRFCFHLYTILSLSVWTVPHIFSYDAKSKGAYSYQILAQEVLNHA